MTKHSINFSVCFVFSGLMKHTYMCLHTSFCVTIRPDEAALSTEYISKKTVAKFSSTTTGY